MTIKETKEKLELLTQKSVVAMEEDSFFSRSQKDQSVTILEKSWHEGSLIVFFHVS